jgi:hypothetical protein
MGRLSHWQIEDNRIPRLHHSILARVRDAMLGADGVPFNPIGSLSNLSTNKEQIPKKLQNK